MKIISGVYWEKGKRASNQDSVMLQQVMTSRGRVLLAAVSDGIGGLSEGETASGYILEKLSSFFYDQVVRLVGRQKGVAPLKRCMLRCFYQINQDLNAYAKVKEIRLGATVSVLLVWKRRYMIVHLGDSRIYQCGSKGLKVLTRDHSESRGLLKCLGSFGFQYPDMYCGRVWGEKGFLLCTDGFFRRMSEREAGEVLSPSEIKEELQAERRLKSLGEAVLKKGEADNCSAVYVKVW